MSASRRNSEGTGTHSLIFAAAALAGVVSIVVLKLIGIPQWAVTSGPLLIMLAYASLIVMPHYRARSDQIGDNLYYLGFVFTLASLAISLQQFSSRGNVDQIIGNFGIALFTTLTGVALRVAFNQMRADPLETERTARIQLAEAARRLKGELMGATREFSMAARASSQSVADGVAEMQQILADTLERSSEQLRQAMATTAKQMGEMADGLRANIESTGGNLTRSSQGLAAAIDATAEQVRGSGQGMLQQQQEFTGAGTKLTGSVERLAKRVDAAVSPADPIQARVEALTAALAALERTAEAGSVALANAGAEAAGIVDLAKRTQESARGTAEAAMSQAEGVASAATIVADAADSIRAAEAQPERLREALDRLDERLAGSAAKIVSDLAAALTPAISAASDPTRLAPVIQRLEAILEELRGPPPRAAYNSSPEYDPGPMSVVDVTETPLR